MKWIICLILITCKILVTFQQEVALDEEKFLAEIINFTQTFKDDGEIDDSSLTMEEIVTKKGYPLSSYFVTTNDGYILKLFRIPGPKASRLENVTLDPRKRVVLLQHGLFDSSDSWVSNYESKSLPFILANRGYDVWLGNNRGNKYSRNHLTLNPSKDKEFWRFSLHEMGTLDLPAMIDFILKETGREKISYIGHSQGTAQMFAALTIDNEYFSQRINAFMALGPVTNLHNIGSSFLKIMATTRLDELLIKYNVFNEMLPNKAALMEFQKLVCGKLGFFCTGLLELLADSNPKDDEQARFLVFISHFPSGTSLRTVHHFAQIIRNNRFGPLDANLPPYALENIRNIPISLFVGNDDLLATPADNRILRGILSQNGVLEFHKEYSDMGHATFFLSKNNEHLEDMLPILDRLNEKDL